MSVNVQGQAIFKHLIKQRPPIPYLPRFDLAICFGFSLKQTRCKQMRIY